MRVLQVAVLGLVLCVVSVRADSISFSPTGSGPSYTISAMDPGVGNSLAVGSVPTSVGQTFQLDYQAAIGTLLPPSGPPLNPPGLGSTYQITAVGSFTEVVTNASPNLVTFALAPTQAKSSFFELYQNPVLVANSLAGTGFNVGTMILSGVPSFALPNVGIFSLALSGGQPVLSPFDTFINGDYPGIQTVVGSGSFLSGIDVLSTNTAFFHTPVSTLSFNSSLITPFNQQNPSMLFVGGPGGGPPSVVPNIGTINGVNGTDFQFQSDANFSLHASAIPEPSSVILLLIGLLGILMYVRLMRGRSTWG